MKDWRDAGLKVLLATFRALRPSPHRGRPAQDHRPPTLVVRGARGPIVPQGWAEEATGLLRDGRLVVMPDASHTITNTRPEQFVESALPFLLGGEPRN